MFGKSGNEIRFADEILPGGQDEIPAAGGDEIRPSVGLGLRDKTPRACQSGTPASAHKMNSQCTPLGAGDIMNDAGRRVKQKHFLPRLFFSFFSALTLP